MEVKRATNKDGVDYRIYNDGSYFFPIYSIEVLKVYYHDDGTPCDVWCPVHEPQKLFTKLEDAEVELNKIIEQ